LQQVHDNKNIINNYLFVCMFCWCNGLKVVQFDRNTSFPYYSSIIKYHRLFVTYIQYFANIKNLKIKVKIVAT